MHMYGSFLQLSGNDSAKTSFSLFPKKKVRFFLEKRFRIFLVTRAAGDYVCLPPPILDLPLPFFFRSKNTPQEGVSPPLHPSNPSNPLSPSCVLSFVFDGMMWRGENLYKLSRLVLDPPLPLPRTSHNQTSLACFFLSTIPQTLVASRVKNSPAMFLKNWGNLCGFDCHNCTLFSFNFQTFFLIPC